jgi:hypothetical protein
VRIVELRSDASHVGHFRQSVGLAGVLLVASIYCALWFFAASDLAFIPCNGHFSVFAPTFRCRQPYVAAGLFVVLVLFAAGVLLFAYRRRKRLAGQ